MKSNLIYQILLPAAFILSFTASGAAQIFLDGPVSGNIAVGSYVVKNKIVVAPKTELLLDPGVEIRFSAGASFEVYGSIRAFGSSTEPVNLTSIENAHWNGLRVYQGARTIMLQSVLIVNSSGIVLSDDIDTLRISLQRCSFRNCPSGISLTSGKTVVPITAKPVTLNCDYPKGMCNFTFAPIHHEFISDSGAITKKPKAASVVPVKRSTIAYKVIVVLLVVTSFAFGYTMFMDHGIK